MRIRMLRNRRGFNLIELMIVMSIIGILASIAAPNYRWGLIKAKESVLRENLYSLNSTIDQYYADRGEYPNDLKDLVDKQYLPKIPKDPFTGQADWVTLSPAPLPEGGGEVKGAVQRVKSSSHLISSDGKTPYNEWD